MKCYTQPSYDKKRSRQPYKKKPIWLPHIRFLKIQVAKKEEDRNVPFSTIKSATCIVYNTHTWNFTRISREKIILSEVVWLMLWFAFFFLLEEIWFGLRQLLFLAVFAFGWTHFEFALRSLDRSCLMFRWTNWYLLGQRSVGQLRVLTRSSSELHSVPGTVVEVLPST